MRATSLFFLLMLVCLVLASLLTAPLLAGDWLTLEPHRVMSRLAQALILLAVWPMLLALRLTDPRSLGYGVPRAVLQRALLLGWLAGVVILLMLVVMLLVQGIRVPDATPPSWLDIPGLVLKALIAGFLVAFLEETFFRGALHTAIRRSESARAAITWSALLYAIVHFMKPAALPEGMAPDLSGTLWMLGQALTGLFDLTNLDSLAALFMAGVLLGQVRERTGHIGWCIGLHAGWVLVIQVSRKLTDTDAASPLAWLAGDYDGTIGWLAALWLAALSLLYHRPGGPRSV